MIEKDLRTLVREAIAGAHAAGELRSGDSPIFDVTQPQRREHGDWSTNVAFVLTKQERKPPEVIAKTLIDHLPQREWVREVQIAGKGFINFHLSNVWLHETCSRVLEAAERFGSTDEGAGRSVNIEFVSINPTGPLHIGSARNAALGDAIARLLESHGYAVTREYYFNDAGSQMSNFGASVAVRYLELLGRTAKMPDDGYVGGYVRDIAQRILEEDGEGYAQLPFEELGEKMRELAYPIVIDGIERSLERFRVHMDVWFKERELYELGKVDDVLRKLEDLGYVYEQEGAKWLRTTDFGDSRDRPVVRSFGAKEPTYLLPDLAYHLDKASRGFETMIVVLGADHHGHAPSLKAGMQALGVDPDRIESIIYQWVHMVRGDEELSMSKRAGSFVTLDELMDEVGIDAARYTLLSASAENTLRFDIEEVKQQSLENPVYYVQYGHARIASILRHAAEQGVVEAGEVVWDELRHEAEVELMRAIAGFEETALVAAHQRAPYRLTKYAEELARHFHRFYTECRVVTDDETLTRARLALSRATMQVLANALRLLGVDAPERMERVEE
ncbi:MAG TPA: arginine--tRNA ligase [Actinomycetota bacterium]|nr:arginine--tRNA ligase [Actinomycetota bacterium]